MTGGVLWVGAALAAEPGVDLHGPRLAAPTLDLNAPVRVPWVSRLRRGELAASASLAHAGGVGASADGLVGALVVAGAASLHERFQVDLHVPLTAYARLGEQWSGPAFGDASARAMVVLVRPERGVGGPGLGLVADLSVPSGGQGFGVRGPSPAAQVVGGWTAGRLTAGVSAGARGVPGIAEEDAAWVAPQLGATVGLRPFEGLGVGLEAVTHATRAGAVGAELGLRVRTAHVFLGASVTAARAEGLPVGRLLVGGVLGRRIVDPVPDADSEGVARILDRCPLRTEVRNGLLDGDGCPDELAPLSAQVLEDGVAVPATVRLVAGAEVREVEVGHDGLGLDVPPGQVWTAEASAPCGIGRGAARAAEAGAVLTVELSPHRPHRVRLEAVDAVGAPVAAVASLIAGTAPRCVPDAPLPLGEGGAPIDVGAGEHRVLVVGPHGQTGSATFAAGEVEQVTVRLDGPVVVRHGDRLRVEPGVDFDGSSPTAGASASLDALAAALRAAAGVDHEVGVHGAAQGEALAVERLTRERAVAVRQALIARGVDPARLIAVGHGWRQPLRSNRSAQGRAANERVEVRALEDSR